MRRSTLLTAVAAGIAASVLLTLAQPGAWAHCEVPCGIYDDHARPGDIPDASTRVRSAPYQTF